MVVEDKRLLGVGPQHLGAAQLVHGLRSRHQIVHLDRTQSDERRHDAQDHPPDPIERQRQGDDEERRDHAARESPGARQAPAGRREEPGKLRDHIGVGAVRAHPRQVSGR